MTQKILVVEDDPVFRNYLHQVLKYDYNVLTAPGPLDALEALRQDKFALMITDLRMPDMDGRALVEKVRSEIDPNIMVIVITAFEDDWPIDLAMNTEVFRYLRKGAFLPSELKQNVSKALEIQGSIVSLEEYKRRADISETLYKDVFDKSTDALFITDINLRPVAVNERFVEHCGYSLDDLRGKTLFDIIDEPERQQAVDAFDARISGNEPGMIKVRILRKDGARRETRIWARVVHGIHDMSKAVFCIARDVSEPGKVVAETPLESLELLNERIEEKERQIRSQAGKFQRLADHAKEIVIWLDRDFTCEFLNHEVQRLLGYTADELLNRKIPWSEIIHPEDYHIVETWQDAASNRSMAMEGEIRVHSRSKHMLFLSYRLSIQYDQSGSFSGLDIVAEDITQQKIAEQELRKANRKIQEFNARLTEGVSRKIRALRESEERYKQIVEDSHDIIFSVDTEARMIYMNKKGLQTLQVNPEDISMRPCREFIADDVSEKKLQTMIET
ncbi:PAS domain S-box protein, partial [bacterium]|nr:PAS domain S-box protein [bacterium]